MDRRRPHLIGVTALLALSLGACTPAPTPTSGQPTTSPASTPTVCTTAEQAGAQVVALTDAQVAAITGVAADEVRFAGPIAVQPGDLLVADDTAVGESLFRLVTGISNDAGAFVVATCDPGEEGVSGTTGMTIAIGSDAELTVPADAFPVGTVVHLAAIDAPTARDEVAQVDGLVSASGGVVVVADGGIQPAVPVTLTLPVPTSDALREDVGYVFAALSRDGNLDYVPAALDAASGRLTATVSHFTSFWTIVVSIKEFAGVLFTRATEFLGLTYDPPDCYRPDQTYELGAESYLVHGVEGEVAYLCLAATPDGGTILTLSSNHGAAFRVGTEPGGEVAPAAGLDVTGWIVQAFMNLIDPSDGQAPFLYSGATLDVRFPPGQVPTTVTLDVDPGPTLASSLLYGVTTLAAVFGLNSSLLDAADTAQCVFSMLDDAEQFSRDRIGAGAGVGFVRAVIDCFSAGGERIGLSRLGSMVLGVIGTGVGLIASGVSALVSEIEGSAHQTISITPLSGGQSPVPDPTPSGSRACPFDEPLSPAELVKAGASCAWGYSEYCDCV